MTSRLVQVFLLFVTITAYASAQDGEGLIGPPPPPPSPPQEPDIELNDGHEEDPLPAEPVPGEIAEVIPVAGEVAEVIPVPEELKVAGVIPVPEEPKVAEVIPVPEEPKVAEVIPVPEEPKVAEVIPVPGEPKVAEVIAVPEEPKVTEELPEGVEVAPEGEDPFAGLKLPALMCYECQSAISNQHCIKTGKLARCEANQGSCQNTVRINNGELKIRKGCKQTEACQSPGKLFNQKKWGVHTECSFSWRQTTCRCCCQSSKCNSRPLYCISDEQPDKYNKIEQEIGKSNQLKQVVNVKTETKRKQPTYDSSWRAREAHPCSWSPCGNGAECIKLPYKQYKCKCKPGWRDSHCNTPVSKRERAVSRWQRRLSRARSGLMKLFNWD